MLIKSEAFGFSFDLCTRFQPPHRPSLYKIISACIIERVHDIAPAPVMSCTSALQLHLPTPGAQNWWRGQLAVSLGSEHVTLLLGKTAYWSILAPHKNHYWQTALIVLIGLELIMILGSGWLCSFLVTRAVRSLDAAHLFLYPLSRKKKHGEPRPHLWHTACGRCDSGWQ